MEFEETNFFTCFVNLFSEKIYMILITLIIFSAEHSLRILGHCAMLRRFGENPVITMGACNFGVLITEGAFNCGGL